MIWDFENIENRNVETWAKVYVWNFLEYKKQGYPKKESISAKKTSDVHNDFYKEMSGEYDDEIPAAKSVKEKSLSY